MPSKVVLIRCEEYDIETVETAVSRGIHLLGGIDQFSKPNESILLKPNLLAGESPDKCISPHPLVFGAIAKLFKSAGANLTFGDSPGFGSTQSAAKGAGLLDVAEDLGVTIADFSNSKEVQFPIGKIIKKFEVAADVLESDGLVNISKLKTHALTRITGAIKNTFGCVPGARKAEFHSVLPTPDMFSKMLVDLNLLLKPRLYIMDGIMAMEGNGPRNGTPKAMNALLFSTDPVALDTTVCHMIDLDPNMVEPIRFGEAFGLGTSSEIEFLGDELEQFRQPNFNVNRNQGKTAPGTSFLSTSFLRKYSAPRPTIDAESCTRCGRCVEVCPAVPKALSWSEKGTDAPPIYDYGKCIRCYCCQEMCPFDAIFVRTPFLGKMIRS